MARRLLRAMASFLDPGTYFQLFRLLHFYHYTHVSQRRRLTRGEGARIAPNISMRHAERISIGAWTNIGERVYLWAGPKQSTITIGRHCRVGPEVFITCVNYGMRPGEPMAYQERSEGDIIIGDDVWLGTRVFIGAGVTIGDGCVVGANSVVTRDLPSNSIAVGIPARVVRKRDSYALRPNDVKTTGEPSVPASDVDAGV